MPLKGSKLMEQRMQMAQAEQDPNVAHYAQADVEARTNDPAKWEQAQIDSGGITTCSPSEPASCSQGSRRRRKHSNHSSRTRASLSVTSASTTPE